MAQAVKCVGRIFAALVYTPRKRVTAAMFILIAVVFTIAVWSIITTRLVRETQMELKVADMQAHLQFLTGLYRARHEELLSLQKKGGFEDQSFNEKRKPTVTPEVAALLKNLTGTHAAKGIYSKTRLLRSPFVYQLLPHLMEDLGSLKPAYHMKGSRNFTDIVIGIPTVKRDKESYLTITLKHLIDGMRAEDLASTLIVVFVGETNLEYVLNTAIQIETLFPRQVASGLIEVISPAASFYPNLDAMTPTLGDSFKRFRWRTKQNLDTMYLMAYARTKGTYYLMLEDDTICKKSYMEEIKLFTSTISVSNQDWFFIEYCPIGGIGKLFRSSDLFHFITYVQLFYHNMPIDWLLESYLADRVCTIEKASNSCKQSKLEIRPKYKNSLFQHIGLYSSLKGKVHKAPFENLIRAKFYPHKNPRVSKLITDIKERGDHTLRRAYDGLTFFWGSRPKEGNIVEFWFEKPTMLQRYTFRSGNLEHVLHKFYHTTVEVLPAGQYNFTQVGVFDEFGMAEGTLDKEIGNLSAIRLKVYRRSAYLVILSEIELKPFEKDDSR